jgi:hypothetical protein
MSSSMSCGDLSNMEIPKKPPHKSASEHRRATKPIMEKRRRARINNSLNELKSLLLAALNKDPSRHSKLEKADILEMTVRHLQDRQRQHMAMEMARDPSVLNKFREGFSQCATEVSRFVQKVDGVDHGVKQRLINHLSDCCSSLTHVTNSSAPVGFPAFPGMVPTGPNGQPLQVHIPHGMTSSGLYSSNGSPDSAVNLTTGDLNNNRSRLSGLDAKQQLTTPPPSGSSQFSFQFPPNNTHSPSTPTTPSTPRGLSIAVSPSAFPGPASMSSGYGSFSFPSPSSRYQPYARRENLGSISPCSRSSLSGGSLSPTGSESIDMDLESKQGQETESEDVWRPW